MTKTKAFLQKHRWSLTGALLGALVFLVLYGVRVLDPVCVDWILNNPSPDPSQHYLGWVFYRRSGWHLPYLGANYSAIYPYRTSILYTDSIPLLAVVCKLLGGVLPARFQYLGLWGLFCYAMQGGLAQALIARIGGVRPQDTAKNWASVLGAGVLVALLGSLFARRIVLLFGATFIVYLLFYFALASQWKTGGTWAFLIGLAMVLERALAGLSLCLMPCARNSGLARIFADGAAKKNTGIFLAFVAILAFCGLVFVGKMVGGLMGLAAFLLWLWYDAWAKKELGGITGDLQGYFVQLCEMGQLAVLVFATLAL